VEAQKREGNRAREVVVMVMVVVAMDIKLVGRRVRTRGEEREVWMWRGETREETGQRGLVMRREVKGRKGGTQIWYPAGVRGIAQEGTRGEQKK
jgi:hypothetical protein